MRDLRHAALRLDDEQPGPRRAVPEVTRSDAFLRRAVLHLARQYGADPEGTDPEWRYLRRRHVTPGGRQGSGPPGCREAPGRQVGVRSRWPGPRPFISGYSSRTSSYRIRRRTAGYDIYPKSLRKGRRPLGYLNFTKVFISGLIPTEGPHMVLDDDRT